MLFFFVAVIDTVFVLSAAADFVALADAGGVMPAVSFAELLTVLFAAFFADFSAFSPVSFAAGLGAFFGAVFFAAAAAVSSFFAAVRVRGVFFTAVFSVVAFTAVRFFGAVFFAGACFGATFSAAAAPRLSAADSFFATASAAADSSLTGVPAPLCRFKR